MSGELEVEEYLNLETDDLIPIILAGLPRSPSVSRFIDSWTEWNETMFSINFDLRSMGKEAYDILCLFLKDWSDPLPDRGLVGHYVANE